MQPARLALAVGVAALASIGVAAADSVCKPSAKVTGEAPTVVAVETVLRGRGIELVAAIAEGTAFVDTPCRHVRAEVVTGGGRIMVWITDGEGRRSQRMAEDAEAAASVIESWARGDLVDPLLAARGTIEVGPDSSSTSGVRTTASVRPHFAIVGGADLGMSGDGAVWAGGRVHGCGALGAFCLGGTVRYAIDTAQRGDTKQLATARRGLGMTLTGERPIRRGAFAIVPGLGVGLTSVTATLPDEDELEEASAIHVAAGLAAAYEFAPAWSLRVDLQGEFAPAARERLGEPDGVDRQLAASPKLQTWFGIAIGYGGP